MDMGFTTIDVRVLPEKHSAPQGASVPLLVDTGSAITIIPGPVLRGLRVKAEGKISLKLADGKKISRDYADLYLKFRTNGKDERVPARVVFGHSGDTAVLGVPVLETAGYGVDPISRKLIKVGHLVA